MENGAGVSDLADTDITLATSLTTANPNNGNGIEVLSANPLYAEYKVQTDNYVDLIYRACGLDSPVNSATQKTSGEIFMDNSRDTALATYTIRNITATFRSLIAKSMVINKLYKTVEEALDNFTLNIHQNTMLNTMNETTKLITQISGNLISRAEAISQLRSTPMSEAEKIAEKISKDNNADLKETNELMAETQMGDAKQQGIPTLEKSENGESK